MEHLQPSIDLVVTLQIRSSNIQQAFPDDLKYLIIKYLKDTITIQITSDDPNETYKVIVKPHILVLSKYLHIMWDESQDYLRPICFTIPPFQVGPLTFSRIIEYLEHHDGNEPPALPCPVRSTDMKQIVIDPWDADFIDKFTKKQIFELILGGSYLDCKSLLHLGCAKIATLIKQLDQKEINRIIEEEENYRRQHESTPTILLDPLEENNTQNSENDTQTTENDTENTENQTTDDDYTSELRSLLLMGFEDDDENLNALVSSNGDIETAVDILVTPRGNL